MPPASAAKIGPEALGANTAITGYGLIQAIDLIRELGFPSVEIHPMGKPERTPGQFPGFEFDRLTGAERRRIRQALEGFREVTSHLPYTDLSTLSRFDPIAEFSRKRVETALEGSAFFGCTLCVLHPQQAAGRSLEETWPEMLRLYRRWGDMAKARNMRIALETGYPHSVRDFVRLVEEIGHSHVGATIDVGHQSRYTELLARVGEERSTPAAIRAYNDTTIEIVERLGSKTFHLHVHDIDPETWAEHKPFVHGFVDYPRLLAALSKIGYQGLLMFEIGGDPEEMPGYLRDGKAKLEAYLAAM